jgi:hypothetical protein
MLTGILRDQHSHLDVDPSHGLTERFIMDFDERVLRREHVLKAIEKYLSSPGKHHPAKSAFLIHKEFKLPAKFIIRSAFEIATGHMPHPETLTGGKASIRVLQKLGFDNAVYEKQNVVGGTRNVTKSVRREALRKKLAQLWGPVEIEKKIQGISVPDLKNRSSMDPILFNILQKIEAHRRINVQGKMHWVLAFDFFLPRIGIAIEFDERQHFTPLRAEALKAYPPEIVLGFDKEKWILLSEEIRAGDNSPIYRDEQRAFYDSVRDITVSRVGLKPVVRIFEEDVQWEKDEAASSKASMVLDAIGALTGAML